jgi:hypothetical protein
MVHILTYTSWFVFLIPAFLSAKIEKRIRGSVIISRNHVKVWEPPERLRKSEIAIIKASKRQKVFIAEHIPKRAIVGIVILLGEHLLIVNSFSLI